MDAKDEVKARLNIEDVVGEYVQLKRSGGNYKGLSPFSSERTPSFNVNPERQIWHDFSSGRGGDVFSFVMEMEGLDFRGALELLARKAGVDLEQFRGKGSGEFAKQKERLYEALELACTFYQKQFSQERTALEYVLQKRAFTKQTALDWRLGYSPADGSSLMKFLTTKGFTADEIQKAGLSAKRFRGPGDMFRGRVMIPLCDPQGRVIGFTARLLKDDKNAPKYINTPQTPLYDKSRHVFGLHHAKEALRQTKVAVLVEGNLDVISSHQAEVKNVVATAGTALTEQHLKALSRFTSDIRLSFDADKAGINATERSIPVASKVGVSLSIITIPSGKDPDELVRQDPAIWQRVINQQVYALDWLMERYGSELDITSAQGKREFRKKMMPVIAELQDKVEQKHYVAKMAELLGMSEKTLDFIESSEEIAKAEKARQPVKQFAPQQLDRAKADYLKTQDNLLAVMLHQPTLRASLSDIPAEAFVTDEARQMTAILREHPDLPPNADQPQLQGIADYGKILELQYEELYRGVDTLELSYEVTRLQAKLIQKYAIRQNTYLQKRLAAATEDSEREELLRQVNQLNALRNQARNR